MSKMLLCTVCALAVVLAVCGCSSSGDESGSAEERAQVEGGVATPIASFALDDAEGVIDGQLVAVDADVTSDGGGSLLVTANAPTTVRLFELGDVDVEEANLSCAASVRSEGLDGIAYLELLCSFSELGEYFSRALESPATGDSDWAVQEVAFLLQKGQNPDNIKLNLIIDGTGTVWIDDLSVSVLAFPG